MAEGEFEEWPANSAPTDVAGAVADSTRPTFTARVTSPIALAARALAGVYFV